MARKRLGELLLERRIITSAQLEQALHYQRQTGHRLGAALLALGFLTETQLCDALALALEIRAVATLPTEPDWTALHSLRRRFCETNDLFPLAIEARDAARKTLVVAMADPLNLAAIEEIEFTTGFKAVSVIAPLSGIRAAIRQHYGKEPATQPPSRPVATEPSALSSRAGAPGAAPEQRSSPAGQLPVLAATKPLQPPDERERAALAQLINDRAAKRRRSKPAEMSPVDEDLAYLFGMKTETPDDELAKLETKFWALLRIMARKGLITREEFLHELVDEE